MFTIYLELVSVLFSLLFFRRTEIGDLLCESKVFSCRRRRWWSILIWLIWPRLVGSAKVSSDGNAKSFADGNFLYSSTIWWCWIYTHTHARTHASSVLKDENFSHPTVPFMPKPASLFYCQRFLYLSFSSPNVLSWIEMKNFYTIEPQKKRKFTSCGWKFAWIFSRRDARRYWGFVGFSHCKKR